MADLIFVGLIAMMIIIIIAFLAVTGLPIAS